MGVCDLAHTFWSRVTAVDAGIAGSVDPNSGGNDPSVTAVGGVYKTMWNVYLNDELKYTSTSPFVNLNDQVFLNWNFAHIDRKAPLQPHALLKKFWYSFLPYLIARFRRLHLGGRLVVRGHHEHHRQGRTGTRGCAGAETGRAVLR